MFSKFWGLILALSRINSDFKYKSYLRQTYFSPIRPSFSIVKPQMTSNAPDVVSTLLDIYFDNFYAKIFEKYEICVSTDQRTNE